MGERELQVPEPLPGAEDADGQEQGAEGDPLHGVQGDAEGEGEAGHRRCEAIDDGQGLAADGLVAPLLPRHASRRGLVAVTLLAAAQAVDADEAEEDGAEDEAGQPTTCIDEERRPVAAVAACNLHAQALDHRVVRARRRPLDERRAEPDHSAATSVESPLLQLQVQAPLVWKDALDEPEDWRQQAQHDGGRPALVVGPHAQEPRDGAERKPDEEQ
mmetsp:Transcript_25886/g.65884  ORF Transcript_25886/g.65884 Transcript_25886/m.65884 type:complete len:216 (+) Transcript_25886:2055-2702(+)